MDETIIAQRALLWSTTDDLAEASALEAAWAAAERAEAEARAFLLEEQAIAWPVRPTPKEGTCVGNCE